MKVFISWSGIQSKSVATALRNWIKLIIQNVEPWMSEKDIQAGAQWNAVLEKELAEAIFGISCMTPYNLKAPMILFEAGALATKVKKQAFLCPYLIDLEPSDLEYPLAQFQARKADKTGTLVSCLSSISYVAVPNICRRT